MHGRIPKLLNCMHSPLVTLLCVLSSNKIDCDTEFVCVVSFKCQNQLKSKCIERTFGVELMERHQIDLKWT